jgi:Zn-dependent protease with chaperone function
VPLTRRSPSYRYKWEIPALIFSLVLMFYGTMWVFGLVGDIIIDTDTNLVATLEDFGFTMLVGLLLLLGSIVLIAWRARAKLHRLQRSGVCVNERQFPELYALSEECRKELGVTKPVDVYVVDAVPSGSPPVGTRGVWPPPYYIIIAAVQVHTRTPDELRFLLGREYGHVRYGHVPIMTLIDTLGGDLGRVPFVGGIINFIFAGWMRAATHTADRAGLLVVQDLNHVYSTLVKLVVGPTLYERVDHGALAAQVRNQGGRRHEEAILWFASPFDSTPMGRFEDMLKFAKSPLYRRLREESLPAFAHQADWEE